MSAGINLLNSIRAVRIVALHATGFNGSNQVAFTAHMSGTRRHVTKRQRGLGRIAGRRESRRTRRQIRRLGCQTARSFRLSSPEEVLFPLRKSMPRDRSLSVRQHYPRLRACRHPVSGREPRGDSRSPSQTVSMRPVWQAA